MKMIRAAVPALGVLASLPATAAGPAGKTGDRPMVLPFLHDDYARALGEARARRLPLFIEAWAPW